MVIEAGRYANRGNTSNDVIGASRRIRQEDDSLTKLHECVQAFYGAGQRGDAIMDDPPEVQDEPVVEWRQLPHSAGELKFHIGLLATVTVSVRLSNHYSADGRRPNECTSLNRNKIFLFTDCFRT